MRLNGKHRPEGSVGHHLGAKTQINCVHRDKMIIISDREAESSEVLSYHLTHKKKGGKKQNPSTSGPKCLVFTVCDCHCTTVSQHLAEVLTRIRSLLGLNDNRNYPNSKGNYLSGDLSQSGKFSFRIFCSD